MKTLVKSDRVGIRASADAPGADLKDAFTAFSDVAQRLQTAYDALKETAARLDGRLAEANERLRAKVEELENLSGALAAVLRAIPCGVVVGSLDGTILMANPAAEAIVGLKGRALVGRRAADLVDEAGRPLLDLAAGPRDPSERVIHAASGARIVQGAVVSIVEPGIDSGAAAGAPPETLGLVEVLNDRSEVKALQEEVRRLDRLAELGRVAAIIAHEIRNPLAGIRGFAGLLERDLHPRDGFETQARWSRRINEGVERADKIIDSVLFLARPKPLSRKPLDCESLLLDAFEEVALAHPQAVRGIRVSRKVTPPGLAVLGDEVRLKQALSNLVQNAVQALGGRGRLALGARVNGGRVELDVADSGPGVPADVAPRLFEPFFTTRTEGAGLGLALVARIAELHGGRVLLRRGIGTGARFVLSLPASARPSGALPEVPSQELRDA